MRLKILYAFILTVFLLLLARVYYLSIKSNIYYEEMAKANAIKSIQIAPTRGLIYDNKGRLLATNDLGFSIAIKPYLNIKKANRKQLDEELAFFAQFFPDMNTSKIRQNYIREDSPYNQDFIEVVEFVPYDKMIPYFSEVNLRENLQIRPTVNRRYPYGAVASHIIGYLGRANLDEIKKSELAKLTRYIGKSGIEKHYNDLLQGKQGVREVKVNAFNKEIEELFYEAPKSQDITLTIDIELQKFLSEIFAQNAGVAIIMDAQNGEILAAGSFPEYDINLFVSGISQNDWDMLNSSPDHPFINKMINGLYPPGSVVKMGVGLSYMNSGFLNVSSSFRCEGVVELSDRIFRCWNRTGHGRMNLRDAIKHSCDIYFYEGALKVGIDKIAPTLLKLGFGEKTGIDLPNEFIGVMPNREWKMRRYGMQWYRGETLNTSIGQGNFLVTPMQIAKYTAQIASEKRIRPHFLREFEDANLSKNLALNLGANSALNLGANSADKPTITNFKDNEARLKRGLQNTNNKQFAKNEISSLNLDQNSDELFTLFEQKQLPLIREAMWAVANEPGGTAYRYFQHLPLKVAAKTGTAQVVGFSQTEKRNIREKDLEYYSRSHTWLTSFAPYDKPKYVVTVLLEHGGRTLTSNAVAIQIYEKLIQMGYLQREITKPQKRR